MAILDPDEMGEIEYGKLNITDSLFFGVSLLYLQRIRELEKQVAHLESLYSSAQELIAALDRGEKI